MELAKENGGTNAPVKADRICIPVKREQNASSSTGNARSSHDHISRRAWILFFAHQFVWFLVCLSFPYARASNTMIGNNNIILLFNNVPSWKGCVKSASQLGRETIMKHIIYQRIHAYILQALYCGFIPCTTTTRQKGFTAQSWQHISVITAQLVKQIKVALGIGYFPCCRFCLFHIFWLMNSPSMRCPRQQINCYGLAVTIMLPGVEGIFCSAVLEQWRVII